MYNTCRKLQSSYSAFKVKKKNTMKIMKMKPHSGGNAAFLQFKYVMNLDAPTQKPTLDLFVIEKRFS